MLVNNSELERVKNIKAVFFDIDNTLFDSTTLAKMARINAIKAMIESGLPIDSVDEGYSLLTFLVKKYGPNYDKHFDKLLETLGCNKEPKIIAAGIVAYHDTKVAYINPDPHVIPTLIALRDRGLKLGVISNGRAVKQWEKIIRLRLHHFLHTVIISEEVGFEKPHPEIFKVALAKLGIAPKEAIYVGDQLEIDVLGANKAGLTSVRLAKEKSKERVSADFESTYTITTISELLSIPDLR
jgi:putative hydrolase of the HAD superfamily